MASNTASCFGTQENFSSRPAQCLILLDSPYAEVCTANRSPKKYGFVLALTSSCDSNRLRGKSQRSRPRISCIQAWLEEAIGLGVSCGREIRRWIELARSMANKKNSRNKFKNTHKHAYQKKRNPKKKPRNLKKQSSITTNQEVKSLEGSRVISLKTLQAVFPGYKQAFIKL